jgi:hypothetical protein
MLGNPCEPQHTCDHCDICEGRTPDGIPRCCGSVASPVNPPPDPVAILRLAIERDALDGPTMRALMEEDALRFAETLIANHPTPLPDAVVGHLHRLARAPRALPPPSDVPLTIPTNKQKEEARAIPKTR